MMYTINHVHIKCVIFASKIEMKNSKRDLREWREKPETDLNFQMRGN